MDNKNFGATLRSLREDAGLSVREVIDKLSDMGIELSEKTLYGYEKGIRMPNGDMLINLCKIYKCTNIISAFEPLTDDMVTFSDLKMIEKYHDLDDHGKEMVDCILEKESQRIKKYGKLSKAVSAVPTRIISYYFKNTSAGTGQIVIDNLPEKDIEIPDKPEYRNVSYAIGVNGNSMEPVFHDGDILLVEATQEINIGEIGIFQINNMCYVKELGQTSLISLNKDYSDIPLNESVRIQGKVIDNITL